MGQECKIRDQWQVPPDLKDWLARPGEFVTSSLAGYKESNGGLTYRDHQVWVMPNKDDCYETSENNR